MTRDTERHIKKLEKAAKALDELGARGADFALANQLAFDLRLRAQFARESENDLVRASALIEHYSHSQAPAS